MASYLLFRRISLWTNLTASSVMNLIGRFSNDERFLFSNAKFIAFLLASIWVTVAPFAAACKEATPE